MTQKLYIVALIAFMLSLSLVNAQTLVAGKVYGNSMDNLVAQATVEIKCSEAVLTTKTLGDGTYAVKFENNVCSLGDSVEAYAMRGTLTGQTSNQVKECREDCDDDYFAVANIMIKDAGSTTYSSSGGIRESDNVQPIKWFICGNNVCDSGENEDTCPKDCHTEPEEQEKKETTTQETKEEKQEAKEITGASVGIEDYISLQMISSILAFLIILLIGHLIIQRRNQRIKI
jgi:hypothetical protein